MIPPPLNIEPLCEILAPSDPQPFEPPVSAQRLETLFLKHLDQGGMFPDGEKGAEGFTAPHKNAKEMKKRFMR